MAEKVFSKRSVAMRDGSLQSSETGAGAEGKDPGHRLSPREQPHLDVGGRIRGREGGVIRHRKGEGSAGGQWCRSSRWYSLHHPLIPSPPSSRPRGQHGATGRVSLGHKGLFLRITVLSAPLPRGCPTPATWYWWQREG